MTIPDDTSSFAIYSTDTDEYYNMSLDNLPISDFHLNTMERVSVDSLGDDLLKCLFLKHAQSLKLGYLPGRSSFINYVRTQTIEREEAGDGV